MKITRPIRAVLFDMDGVMVDSEFVYMKYLLEFAREKNPAVTMEDINPMVGRSRQDSWMVMERAVDNGESWETLIKEWAGRDIYSRIDYRKIFRPEMKTTVQELKRRGYTVALVSSTGPKLISRIVEEVGMRPEFDLIVSGKQFKQRILWESVRMSALSWKIPLWGSRLHTGPECRSPASKMTGSGSIRARRITILIRYLIF